MSGVLEAVADDRGVVVGDGDHGEELRLGAGLEAEPVGLAEVEHLFDDLALLVHLDRVDAAVLALILVLGNGGLKRRVDLAETVLEDVGEPDENGKADTAELQAIDQLLEVDRRRRVLGGVDVEVPGRTDGEVAVAPAADFVDRSNRAPSRRARSRRWGRPEPGVRW
jgi:hypothetical protein